MAWTVFGSPITTAQGSSGTFQKVKFNSNIVLRACRIWLVFYNNPTLTSISMKIYSNSGGSQGKLLHTATNTWSKSQIITENNGVREIYFDWNYPSFDADDEYHFGLFLSGYTGNNSTHVAWRSAWPDPVYGTNFTPTRVNINSAPYTIYFIGSDLE